MIPRALGSVRVRLQRLGASGEVGIIHKQRRVPFFLILDNLDSTPTPLGGWHPSRFVGCRARVYESITLQGPV